MENFEQCLARLMKEHKLNYSELTNLLNYRSKNTLHRILSGESGEKSRSKVFNDIVNNDNIGFSKKDIEELELALEISLIGNEKFEAMSEMRNLLRKKDVEPEEIYITDIESMRQIPIGELKNKIKDFENEIIIINCCWAAISRCLTELMAESPNTKILHYIVISDDTAETIRKIGRVLPMIFNHGYMGYSVRKKINDVNIPDELSYNLIAIRSKAKSGKMYGHQLLMNNENRGYLTNESYHLFDYLQNIVTQNNQKALQIKTTYDQISSADAYLKFTEHYYKMEANNTIYTFKPDICFNYVNAEITKAAFFDGIKQLGIEDLFTNSIVKKLEAVHQKRFENIFTKKKVTQHVCTEKGLKNFAQSGILSDHFFAMRPYTKKERIEILKNILYNEENNPHFNLHLLKCEDDYLNMEMAYFENIGLEITSMDTGYNLKEGHTEAIVKQEDFIELYTQYFTGELLKKCVKPANDSVLFLKQLISELEESEQ